MHSFETMVTQHFITLPAYARGFHLITSIIEKEAGTLPETGLLHLFIQHTSAGICINENADPSVLRDFEMMFDRLAPENLAAYTHRDEGPDDMPAHIKSVLSGCEITIPITHGRLALGTWQGIYLCEYRNHGGRRKLVLTIYS